MPQPYHAPPPLRKFSLGLHPLPWEIARRETEPDLPACWIVAGPDGAGKNEARDLWLRFLREVGRDENAASELAGSSAEMARAVELTEIAAYTPTELAEYDRYWDAVSTEKTLMEGKFADGQRLGLEEGQRLGLEEGQRLGLEEGQRLGLEEGQRQGLDLALANLMRNGISEPEARRLLGMN